MVVFLWGHTNATMTTVDPQLTLQNTVGKDTVLSYARTGVNDAEYQSETMSLFHPAAPMKCRNYFEEWNDVLNTNTTRFGTQVTQMFGNEGYSLCQYLEIIVQLPRLVDAATNTHPDDATYAGTGNFLDWVPFIGERILGDEDTPLQILYAGQPIRDYTSLEVHIKRTLCQDASNQVRAAYLNTVEQGARGADEEIYLICPVWVPWGPDDVDLQQLLPIHAFPQEIVLKWSLPRLAQLVQHDIAAGFTVDPAGSILTPQTSLRVGYVTTEKAERGARAEDTFQQYGLTYKVMHSRREAETIVAAGGGGDIRVPIERSRNPVVFLAAVVRYTSDVADVDPVTNDAPNWTNFLTYNHSYMEDGGRRTSNSVSLERWKNDIKNGFTRYFPGDSSRNICVHVFSVHPTVENHGLGHTNFANYNKPSLLMNLPVDAQERRIDVISFEHNLIQMEAGQLWKAYRS